MRWKGRAARDPRAARLFFSVWRTHLVPLAAPAALLDQAHFVTSAAS
jgi:hypothetical protein